MAEESKGVGIAILLAVAVISAAGLIVLFKGTATAEVSYSYEKPYTFIQQNPRRLCENMDCQNGNGALVIGEQTIHGTEYWVCGCSKQFADKRIADWSNTYTGDPAHDSNEFSNYEAVWLVRKFREY
jgi:hypothetical protein